MYAKSELSGEAEVDGKLCHRVVMTSTAGLEEVYYFDKQSKLLVKLEKHRLFPGVSPMPLTAVLSNYRKVDGILVPHRIAQTIVQCGNKRELTLVTESIGFNVEMPPDQFDPPSEVQLAAKGSAIAGAVKGVLGPASGGKSAGAPCGKKAKAKAAPCGGT